MKFDYLLYYVLYLIREGHKWQYKDLNDLGKSPTLWFSFLQIIALITAGIFVIKKTAGFTDSTIEYMASTLSILIGLYLSLVIFINDKFKNVKWDGLKDTEHIHTWAFYSQFNALASYSILIAVIVTCILFGFLLFGVNIDFANYCWVETWNVKSITLFIKLSLVVLSRFVVVYFLMDFFIICIYAVISLFHYTNKDMIKKQSKKQITNSKDIRDELESFGAWPSIIKIGIAFLLVFVLAFLILQQS